MKKLIYLFIVLFVTSCSKNSVEVDPKITEGTALIKFINKAQISSGNIIEEEYSMKFVMIWKAEGLDLEYNGLGDSNYAIDKKTGRAIKSDLQYNNIKSKILNLYPGEYFIAILTDIDSSPRLAYSYRTFKIESNKVTDLKKDVSNMKSNSFTTW